jgi:hypothetical protein
MPLCFSWHALPLTSLEHFAYHVFLKFLPKFCQEFLAANRVRNAPGSRRWREKVAGRINSCPPKCRNSDGKKISGGPSPNQWTEAQPLEFAPVARWQFVHPLPHGTTQVSCFGF